MNNKKQLSINLIANIVSYSTTLIIAFFLTPFLINVLGKEAYSFNTIAQNFVQYMSILTIALNSMSSRFITIEITKKNYEKANVYFSSVFFSNVIMSAILFVIMTVIITYLEFLLNIPIDLVFSVKVLFALVFASMLVNIITNVFTVAVFAKNRIDLRSLGDIFQALLKLALYGFFFFLFKPNIIFVGLVTFILSLTYALIHYNYKRKLLSEMSVSLKYFDISSIKEILSSGVWNSVYQLGSSLLFSLSILYCNVLISASAGGEYSIVQTIPNFVNGIISMLSAVFLPTITQTYASKPIEDVVEQVKYSQKIMGLITNIPIVGFMVISVDFFKLWVPNENAVRLSILSFFTIFHLLIIGVTWTVANLNTVINKVKVPALYMIGSGLVNFIFVLFFTKYTNLGVYSIPASQLLVLLVWAGIFIPVYPCKELGLKYTTFYGAIVKMAISSIILAVLGVSLRMVFIPNTWFKLLLFCAILGVLGVIVNLMVYLNSIERKNLFNQIKQMLLKKRNA